MPCAKEIFSRALWGTRAIFSSTLPYAFRRSSGIFCINYFLTFQGTLVTAYTTWITIKKSSLPQKLLKTITMNNGQFCKKINWLVFVMYTAFVFCEAGTDLYMVLTLRKVI
jgi:hypothetical protein